MAFTHYHENGTVWFTTKTALSSFDAEDLNEQSAGFYSKEMSSKNAAAELEKIMPEPPKEAKVVDDIFIKNIEEYVVILENEDINKEKIKGIK